MMIGFIGLNNPQKLEAASIKNKAMKELVSKTKWTFDPYTKGTPKKYPTKKGTILVTPDPFLGLIPTGHSAIVIDKDSVIESNKVGVVYGKNNWFEQKKYTIALRVKGLSDAKHNAAAVQATKHLKKKYNLNYLNYKTRNSFYCSQLVWSAFYDLFNINLDTNQYGMAMKSKVAAIHPLELAHSNLTEKVFMYDNIKK